jgi:hypothetical protein
MEHSPLKLDSYQLSKATAEELGVSKQGLASMSFQPLKLTICGEYFEIAAIVPTIKIGDFEVTDFDITDDQCGIVCYLYDAPPEGGKICIDYGRGRCGETPEPFSLSRLNADETSSND